MFYYKTLDNELHALDEEKFAEFLPTGYVQLTDVEYLEIVSNKNKVANAKPAAYEKATWLLLDELAKEWKYDSMTEVATYLTSKVAKYKAEAEILIAWRDSTWETCDAIIAKIENAAEDAPTTVEDFLAKLPTAPTKS